MNYDHNQDAEIIDTDLENYFKFGEYSSEKQRRSFEENLLKNQFKCPLQRNLAFRTLGKNYTVKKDPNHSYYLELSSKDNSSSFTLDTRSGEIHHIYSGKILASVLSLLTNSNELSPDLYELLVKCVEYEVKNKEFKEENFLSIIEDFYMSVQEEFEGTLFKSFIRPDTHCFVFGYLNVLLINDQGRISYSENAGTVPRKNKTDIQLVFDNFDWNIPAEYYTKNDSLTPFAIALFDTHPQRYNDAHLYLKDISENTTGINNLDLNEFRFPQ